MSIFSRLISKHLLMFLGIVVVIFILIATLAMLRQPSCSEIITQTQTLVANKDYKQAEKLLGRHSYCAETDGNTTTHLIQKGQYYRFLAVSQYAQNDRQAAQNAQKALTFYKQIPDKDKHQIKDNFTFVDSLSLIIESESR